MKYFMLAFYLTIVSLGAMLYSHASNATDHQTFSKCKTYATGEVFIVEGTQCPYGSYWIGYA